MTAQLIDGKQLSQHIRDELRQRARQLELEGIKPGLAVILVGGDPASQVYVRNKIKACADVGVHSVLERYDNTLSQDELLERIESLNQDSSIHGILVQLPLPKHIDPQRIIQAISPSKDVDGFHPASAGALMVGQPGFKPCTPYGCMKMLESIGLKDLSGKHAVIVGRSNIVGKPMAMLLLAANATVTVCHSRTASLADMTRQADILVAAVGRRHMISADMVKPGAVIIDVAINRDENGKLCGDVDFENVKNVASYITPVPGGVGPMTIAMLLTNTLESAERLQQTL